MIWLIAGEKTPIMRRLSKTCHRFHSFFKVPLKRQTAEALSQYILDNNQEKVEAPIKTYPELLLYPTTTVIKRTGQQIGPATPLQLAYGEGNHEMCDILMHQFELIAGSQEAGRKEAFKQLDAKFGEAAKEVDKKAVKETQQDCMTMLSKVITEICAETFNNGRDHQNRWILSPATEAAITTFKAEFAKHQQQPINSNLRSRSLNLLMKTIKMSRTIVGRHYGNAGFVQDRNRLCALLEDAVLAFILEYVPPHSVRRFSNGLLPGPISIPPEPELDLKPQTHYHDMNQFYNILRRPSADFYPVNGTCIDICYGLLPLRHYHLSPHLFLNGVLMGRELISTLDELQKNESFKLQHVINKVRRPHRNTR